MSPLSDAAYQGVTVEEIVPLAAMPGRAFILVADRVALTDPEHPVLVVHLAHELGRSFQRRFDRAGWWDRLFHVACHA
jgi:hypothetical protein